MSRDWDGPSWIDAPVGYDPDRDRKWGRDWFRPAPRSNRLGRRWVRLRRKLALLAVRAADKLQPDDWS